jgi:hypothetical protein
VDALTGFLTDLTSTPTNTLRVTTLVVGMVALNGLFGFFSVLRERSSAESLKLRNWRLRSPTNSLLTELKQSDQEIAARRTTVTRAAERQADRVTATVKDLDNAGEAEKRGKATMDGFPTIEETLKKVIGQKAKAEAEKKRELRREQRQRRPKGPNQPTNGKPKRTR